METNMTLSIAESRTAMELLFKAGIPVERRGASGIGKSDDATDYAEKQGPDYGLFELNAATANLPDVLGLQMPQNETHVNAAGEPINIIAGRFSYPYFMRDKRTGRPAMCFNRGMFLIEEYGQANPDVKRGLAQLIWNRRNGEYLFPEKTDVLILSNRPEDRSGVTKDFDFLINRRAVLDVRASLDPWLVWAHDHGVSNVALAFGSRNEDLVFSNKAPEKQGPWLTPRSLVSADKFVCEAEDAGMPLDHPIVRQTVAGIMGEGNAHQYIAFAKIRHSIPSLQAILSDPQGTDVPGQPDMQMFLVFDLASKATKQNLKPIITYLKRFPQDFAMAFYRSAMQRDEGLRSTKEFGDWAVDNAQLLSAIAGAR
jgi:hypothetical protein